MFDFTSDIISVAFLAFDLHEKLKAHSFIFLPFVFICPIYLHIINLIDLISLLMVYVSSTK